MILSSPKSNLNVYLIDLNSARGIGSSAPVDTLLLLIKDNTLISYTDQRDGKGVSCFCQFLNLEDRTRNLSGRFKAEETVRLSVCV